MRSLGISEMNLDALIAREWISTNGIGGYASSTVCGLNTRKYHGLLVAAMSPPVRRMVLLSHVEETIFTAGGEFALGNNEYPGTVFPHGYSLLRAFNVEPFPRWAYQGDGFTIEKSLRLLQGENTVCLTYSLLSGDKPITLEIRPLLALRPIHELMYQWNGRLSAEPKKNGLVVIPATTRTPEVFFAHAGEFFAEPHWHLNTIYRREEERGYSGLEDLWKPGGFRWTLAPGQTIHLACSTDPVELESVVRRIESAREDFDRHTAVITTDTDRRLEMLSRAVEAFVVRVDSEPPSRPAVSVVGQYPWSPPAARAGLIGFCGLFVIPGRLAEGRVFLEGLAARAREGIIPTELSESGASPAYRGADVSLWFIHALGECAKHDGDEALVASLFPCVEKIIETYRGAGSRHLYCDNEGLIGTELQSVPTSWMDAQVGDWVVTPRNGRAVEINALWFNALMTGAGLAERAGREELAQQWRQLADKVREAFNRRFWNEKLQCCFDVINGSYTDASVRPNQLLAISLPHAVLAAERQRSVVERVIGELLTPMGLRTLSPGDGAYQGQYSGNVVSRERAQHQGSVYPWLIGPLASAYLKVFGRGEKAVEQVSRWIAPLLEFVESDGLGQVCELFDGDAPHTPRGAPAAALGAAELLRVFAAEILGVSTVRTHQTSSESKKGSQQVAASSRP
jgi:predicted glycogen debranching enzyme